MSRYPYLLPLISISPPPGYRLMQSINVDGIGALLDRSDEVVTVSRTLLLGERQLDSQVEEIRYRDRRVTRPTAPYLVEAVEENGWSAGGPLPYLETHVMIEGDGQFTDQFVPPFYTVYGGADRKSFFSDNALKYGNTVTIHQIRAFGAWVEGYPLSMVDPQRDIDESLVLINPFLRPAVVDVTIEGREEKKRFRIDPQTGKRISLAEAFGIGDEGWGGQVYVSGKNRVVMYVAKHSLADPSRVTTVEHSNPYRGEPTHLPMTQVLRRRVGEALLTRR